MASYADKKRLGRGGFGEVWLCVRDSDNQKLARKRLIDNSDRDIVERFIREVRMLETLDHPNIVKVVTKRLTKGPPYYFVMPLFKKSMEVELDSLIGDTDRIQKVFAAILDAVEYAHANGVIHRDLKPANVLMNSDDDVVVSDFGLGRVLGAESTRRTGTGDRFGTELYAAPEQWDNAKSADVRSDVFSLGRMLYELLTSPLASTVQDTSSIDPGIALVIDRCTQLEPEKRFQSVTELKEAWLMVTGASAGLAPSEEITELIAELSARRSVDRNKVERLIEILAAFFDDGDFVHEVLMKLPAPVVAEMVVLNKKFTRKLVRQFVDHTGSQGWPWSYTDKIGSKCRSLYEAIKDYQIRADLVYCVLKVGVNHNRWFVMEIFDELMESPRDGGANLALAERLRNASRHLRGVIRKRVSMAKLSRNIQEVLREKKADDE